MPSNPHHSGAADSVVRLDRGYTLVVLAVVIFVILFVVGAVSKHDSTTYDRIIGLTRSSRGAVRPAPGEGWP